MKTKLFLLLIVALVSTTTFSQDTTFFIKSFQLGFYDETKNVYNLRRMFYSDFEIRKIKDTIFINDGFNSYLKVLYIKKYKIPTGEGVVYHCKDNEGALCSFFWVNDDEKYCQVMYKNVSYFYYTKN